MHHWQGLLRSLVIYYANPRKLWRMRRFYAQFMQPGDLCFDIGAHVGNRLWVWTALGVRVVGVEPQPLCMHFLRRCYGRRTDITLVEEAVGATPGEQTLWSSARTPTVTTLSAQWIQAVRQIPSFATVQWERAGAVTVTTLDDLIARYGTPVFCKIDVEGYEWEVLRGLSHPLRALSFEYIPATKDVTFGCIERLQQLGDYEFNWSVGEQHRWQSSRWADRNTVLAFIDSLALHAPSGDIYARRKR